MRLPAGFWDPRGLSSDGNEFTFKCRWGVGSEARSRPMVACLGYIIAIIGMGVNVCTPDGLTRTECTLVRFIDRGPRAVGLCSGRTVRRAQCELNSVPIRAAHDETCARGIPPLAPC